MNSSSTLPFLDLHRQYINLQPEIESAIKVVCEKTAFSGGYFVEKFESEFANFCQSKYCVGLSNGTSALHLAMLALGIGKGDEVILPANTFIASAWGPAQAGAKPVFADCDPQTWNLDPASVEKKITPRTKAIIGVHLYGLPCAIEELQKICRHHKLFFIEDAAQAQGARFKQKPVGSFGDISCFSFYPGKNLGAYGEAGAITTHNAKYAKIIRCLRDQGSYKKYHHVMIGYNERMDGIQAAILSTKLKYLNQWNQRRQFILQAYRSGIKQESIQFQHFPTHTYSACHLAVISVKNRDKWNDHFHSLGIFPGCHYPIPCHLQKAFSYLKYRSGSLPVAESLSKHCISLPLFPEMTDTEVERVISALNSFPVKTKIKKLK